LSTMPWAGIPDDAMMNIDLF
jgi:hypothetical protein